MVKWPRQQGVHVAEQDSYLTPAKWGHSEVKVKASRFLGEVFAAADEAEAEARLAEIRKRERDARHHCFAWRFGLPGPVPLRPRASDDGEPSGTAGKPMLQLIEGRQLTQTLVVVTRYFGGTLLGTGGLLHAYSEAAKLALEDAGIKEHFLEERFLLKLAFPQYNAWMMEVARLGARIESSEFEEAVTLVLAIRRSKAGLVLPAFRQTTQGRGEGVVLNSVDPSSP